MPKRLLKSVLVSFQPRFQKGFSLISVLVAMAIAGMLSVMVFKMLNLGFLGQKSSSLKSDLESIKRTVQAVVSCQGSLPSGGCTPGAILPLKRKQADGTFADIQQQFGDWSVGGECNVGGDGIIVRAVLMQPGAALGSADEADYRKDPLTKRLITWSDPGSLLFPSGVELCVGGGGGAASDDGIELRGTTTRVDATSPSDGCPSSARLMVLSANCEPGEKVVAGGVNCTMDGFSVRMMVNAPKADRSGWDGACCVKSGNKNNTEVYALCRSAQ